MKKCFCSSPHTLLLPLSLLLFAVISLTFLFAGCGGGAGYESSSFQHLSGDNDSVARQARDLYESDSRIISTPVYDSATNTVSISITILRGQSSASGKHTTRASTRESTPPSTYMGVFAQNREKYGKSLKSFNGSDLSSTFA